MVRMRIGLNFGSKQLDLTEEAIIRHLFTTKSNIKVLVNYDRLYIYGGHDIREGSKNTLWMLDLRKLKDLDLDPAN